LLPFSFWYFIEFQRSREKCADFISNERGRQIERDGKKREKRISTREGMETKFREDEAEQDEEMREKEGRRQGREGLREDSRIAMETWYAMGMGSHACVSSGPAGGGVCSFFPFVFLSLSLSRLFSRCPSHCSDPSLLSRCPLPLFSLRFGASQ